MHPFRFGLLSHNTSPSYTAFMELVRRAEGSGYSTFLVPDHLGDVFPPMLALAMAASASTTLRLGSCVFDNDFRHPVLLAKDAAMLDVLSAGRFELGLGAGWMQSEYEQIGLTFDRPGVRIDRLAEAVRIIKSYLRGESVTFAGQHYTVTAMPAQPAAIQRPHPPLLMGGSGKRMLTLAAQEATIISLIPKLRSVSRSDHLNDLLDMTHILPSAILQKISWIREAAGLRFADLELSVALVDALVTDQPSAFSPFAQRFGLSEQQAQMTPFLLAGSVQQICDRLSQLRELYGISYIVVWEDHLAQLAPVVKQLAGR
jgi:probable F420-dependent oxidoreductase